MAEPHRTAPAESSGTPRCDGPTKMVILTLRISTMQHLERVLRRRSIKRWALLGLSMDYGCGLKPYALGSKLYPSVGWSESSSSTP